MPRPYSRRGDTAARSDGRPSRPRRAGVGRRRGSRLATDPTAVIDYKNVALLQLFLTPEGKIVPRRLSGHSALHQRKLTRAIKRARVAGLLPFSTRSTS